MPNTNNMVASLKQINTVHHFFYEFQHLFRTEQRREVNAYIKNAEPLYEIVKALESKTISQLRTELDSFIKSPTFNQIKIDLSSLKAMVNQVIKNEFVLTHWFPEFTFFPEGITEDELKLERARNFANNQAGMQQLLQELEGLDSTIGTLPYTLYTVSFVQSAASGVASTLVNRALKKIEERLPASPWVGKSLNVVGNVGLIAAIAYDRSATIVAGSAQLATQFVANKLGLKPRTTRQIGQVAAITSLTAMELYQNPSLDNVLHVATTMAGATIGVVGTDFMIDKAAHLIDHGHKIFRGTPKKPRQTAAYLAKQEAVSFMGDNLRSHSEQGIQTRAKRKII